MDASAILKTGSKNSKSLPPTYGNHEIGRAHV